MLGTWWVLHRNDRNFCCVMNLLYSILSVLQRESCHNILHIVRRKSGLRFPCLWKQRPWVLLTGGTGSTLPTDRVEGSQQPYEVVTVITIILQTGNWAEKYFSPSDPSSKQQLRNSDPDLHASNATRLPLLRIRWLHALQTALGHQRGEVNFLPQPRSQQTSLKFQEDFWSF